MSLCRNLAGALLAAHLLGFTAPALDQLGAPQDLAAAPAALAGVGVKSVQIEPSGDDVLYSRFPAGDNPGESSCPTGWTCASIGNGSGNIVEQSATEFDFDVIGSGNTRNSRFAYQDAGGADVQFSARVTNTYAGSTAPFASLGIGLRESTAEDSWFFHCQSLQTFVKAAQCGYGSANPYTFVNEADSESRPITLLITYRPATCLISGYFSTDGTTYTLITQVTRCLSDDLAYAFGQSNSSSETFQATLDNIALSSTITIVDIVAPIMGVPVVEDDDVTIPFTPGTSGAGIQNHEIWRSTDGETYTLLATFTSGSPYQDVDVPNGTYFYQLRARDNDDTVSDFSAAASVTVSVAATAPNPPTLDAPTAVSASQINLSWAADLSGGAPTPTSYELDFSLNGTSGWVNLLTGPGTSFSHTGLSASTQYFYRLRALNGATASGYSTDDATTDSAGGRDVFFTGTFATSTVRGPGGSGGKTDAFLVETLPINQTGDDSFSNSGSSSNCCGSGSGLDSRVVATDSVGGTTVTPRAGPFFYRVELIHGKTYNCLNSQTCKTGDATNKPRSKLMMSQTIHRFDSMVEQWFGFSRYIPVNFEHERSKGQHGNGPTILNINNNQSEGILELKDIIKGSGSTGSDLCSNNSPCLQNNDTKFWASYPIRTTIGEPGYDTKQWRELNDINSCKGKWIDVVVRVVNDPFSSTTDGGGISGAADITYTGNRGVLEIWTGDCDDAPDATGYREMVKRVSVCNAPFGLVQRSGSNQMWTGGLTNYAYGWKPDEPTDRTHSIYEAYDEIYHGQTVRDGTGYADVNPSGKTWESGQAPCSWSGP